jgi:hypothetical protein
MFIQVLCGPRQVGKTTLITQVLRETAIPHVYASADDAPDVSSIWLRQIWDKARLGCKQAGGDYLLVVDEVQKIANWSEVVKAEWDKDAFNNIALKVVLLGSSSLLIQQGLTESLAGRYELIYIPHWSFGEMRDAFGFTLEEYVWFGGYPGAATLVKDEWRWKEYVRQSLIEPSITKDILMMQRVDKPALLGRLFNIGCSYSAQILSLNKIQGELNERGNLATLSNYLKLLASADLLCGLEKYAGNVIRQRASKPKFQVFNNALLSAQNSMTFSTVRADGKLWGRMVESAVGTHLLNRRKTGWYDVFYWNENSKEVDYVIQRGTDVVAIEVKSGYDSSNAGMAVFDELFHPKAMFTVGTDGIPLEEFLQMEPGELFV